VQFVEYSLIRAIDSYVEPKERYDTKVDQPLKIERSMKRDRTKNCTYHVVDSPQV
jgi:hypothetical protein